jgi:hypothetical protein
LQPRDRFAAEAGSAEQPIADMLLDDAPLPKEKAAVLAA